MFQQDLFSNYEETINLKNGKLVLYRNFLEFNMSSSILEDLIKDIKWKQSTFHIHGKSIPIPRLNAWYSDAGKSYKYSGISLNINTWTDSLNYIRKVISDKLALEFNSCLLNLYRDGKDSVLWHADDELELGRCPTICSISLGQERKFMVRSKINKNDKLTILLPHISALIMSEDFQHVYEHQVPKENGIQQPRVNLTFRNVQ